MGDSNMFDGDTLQAEDNAPDLTDGSSDGWSNLESTAYDSSTSTVSFSIYRGSIENGRRYQSLKEDGYYQPADKRQFEANNAGYLAQLLVESGQKNPFFRSPIQPGARQVLDIGCGDGTWAVDVADKFPDMYVRGVDLYPPPQIWVPENCTLEVDDVCKPWIWNEKFDLIHMRMLYGSFSEEQWAELYQQCYDNLAPGGWIEQIEVDLDFYCDDNTEPPSSFLAGNSPLFHRISNRIGRPLDTYNTMASSIAKAGFVNVQEQIYKVPVGSWPRHPTLKEAGRLAEMQLLRGFDGFVTHLLTKYGDPEPWSLDRARVYVKRITEDLKNTKWHKYSKTKRVWAMKPLDEENKMKRKRSDTITGLADPKRSRENSAS